MMPSDWRIARLEEGINLISGQHIKAEKCTDDPSYTPYITGPSDLINGSIVATKYTRTPKAMCEPGDILVTVKGSGTGTIFWSDDRYCISRQLMAIRPKNWDPGFVYYTLAFNTEAYSKVASGLIPGIKRKDILSTQVFLPPPTEQRTIAMLLSTWDWAIKNATQLLEARRRLKRGLMYQLLTGKSCLLGFNKPWRIVCLGDVFSERIEENMGNLPLLSITADRGVIPRKSLDKRDNSSADKSKYKRIAPGDIGYNTMRMWQGVSGLSELEGVVSPAYTVCIPQSGIHGSFAKHLFKFPPIVYRFWRYSQGLVDDTLSLKYPEFAKIKVMIPEIEEQQRIAEVLDLADKQILLLENSLEALKKQKQVLMQKLLTGQIRVKVS